MREIFAKHPHWQQVLSIVQKLNARGFVAFLAGGAVRDALLGRPIHDFDIATDARPDESAGLFPNALDIGKQFGIMMIPIGHGEKAEQRGDKIEIATFRSDGEYLDGRHPQSISFSNAEEDAKRRDFTVNALFFDIQNDRVIDYVDGLKDLKNGVIRAVGEPKKRFVEDKLRLLRAVRFSAQLGFYIDTDTLQAIQELAIEIRVVSRERITAELERLAHSRRVAAGFSTLIETGLFRAIFSTFRFIESTLLRQKFLEALSHLSGVGSLEMILALMIILEQEYGTVQKNAFERLALSRDSRARVNFLVRGVATIKAGGEDALLLLNTEEGPLLSEFGFTLETIGLLPRRWMSDTLERFLNLADASGQLPRPFLNGNDLKNLGIEPGPKLGQVLTELYRRQLRGEIRTREEALRAAKSDR